MRYKAILLFGAPGSGKGTQGKIIGQIPGFFHFSTGDIFRSLDLRSEMGRTVWEYSSKGLLVPDEITIKLVKQRLLGLEMLNQFFPESEILVLDGIPRSVRQAELLAKEVDVLKVIYLRCADLSKMVERLRRRALKENRVDDANDAVIRRRLEVYEWDTRPVLSSYPDDKIVRIDAMQPMIKVLDDIIKVISPLKEEMDRHLGEEDEPQPESTGARTDAPAQPVPATAK
jgi:adenylate kinase